MAGSSSHEVIQLMVLVLIVGNLFAATVGVVMMVAPAWLARWSRIPNKWVSTRPLTNPLDAMHDLDGRLLSRPRVVGVIVLAAAAFILVQGVLFAGHTSVAAGGRLLTGVFGGAGLPSSMWEALWLSLLMFLLLGAILAFVVGTVAIVDPTLLIKISMGANRWISTHGGVEALDAPRYGVDSFVRGRPRLWGAVITLVATYALAVMAWLWRTL